jgi:hypothetical protein
MWFSNLKKHLYLDISSTNNDTLVPSLCHVRRNLQHRSLLTVISATFEHPWENFSTQFWTALSDKHLPRLIENFLYEYPLHWVFLPTKTHNRTLLFCIILLKHSRHFDDWNQSMNMCMRVCYLDCHEAGLCCYLLIHIENLLRPLRLFYFHYLLTLPRIIKIPNRMNHVQFNISKIIY